MAPSVLGEPRDIDPDMLQDAAGLRGIAQAAYDEHFCVGTKCVGTEPMRGKENHHE